MAPAPAGIVYPAAQPVEPESAGDTVNIVSDTQMKTGTLYTVAGNAVLTYRNYVLHADKITYDAATGRTTAEGHLELTGGADNEDIHASHGELNMQTETGHFYDVAGSAGVGRDGQQDDRLHHEFLSLLRARDREAWAGALRGLRRQHYILRPAASGLADLGDEDVNRR